MASGYAHTEDDVFHEGSDRVRRRSGTGLVENERRILLALAELNGEAWSKPLLNEVDRNRTDGMHTGSGTLLRAMTTFERKGIVVTDDRWEPKHRRYYKLTDDGHRLIDHVKTQQLARTKLEKARAKFEEATAAVESLI
jgi:DNA-binding PadR family transcriptional regulator